MRKGSHHTKEVIEKIRKTHIGQEVSEETKQKLKEAKKGRNNSFFGKHHTEETRKKMSEIAERRKGNKNGNWIDGRSYEPYTSEFNNQLKELIRHRDGYKCQKCGCPEIECNRKLDVHHIDYNKKNCLPKNLISLCKKCNSEVNGNRQKWIRYFQKKVRKIMDSNVIQLHFRYKKVEVKCQ